MSVEKIFFDESQKLLSHQLLLKISCFRFHFVSALQYLDCYYIEYPVSSKQTHYT